MLWSGVVAVAAAPEVGGFAGAFGRGPQEPAVAVVGMSFGLRASPVFAAQAEAGGAVFSSPASVPDLSNTVSPSVTRRRAFGVVEGVFSPVQGSIGHRSLAIDLGLGTGVVQTVDDLERANLHNDPVAIETETQIRPVITGSIGPRVVLDPAIELQLRARWMQWIEIFGGVELESQQRVDVVGSVVWRPVGGR